jgi:hypothetical protein
LAGLAGSTRIGQVVAAVAVHAADLVEALCAVGGTEHAIAIGEEGVVHQVVTALAAIAVGTTLAGATTLSASQAGLVRSRQIEA